MGISAAFSIAASGLRSNSIQSNLVATNIANAQTSGYSRKSANLVTRNGSVEVASIQRAVDPLLDRLDRANLSQQARLETVATALSTYTAQLGQPDDETSPVAAMAKLYSSLLTLSGTPTAAAAQLGVVSSADTLARNINSLSTSLNELASEVELNIRYDVADVNDTLGRLAEINTRLTQNGSLNQEGADLLDEQARLLDQLATFMDVQLVTGPDGVVSLYTTGGTELLSGRRAALVTYDSALGTLKAGSVDISPGKPGVRGFSEGSLAGLFHLKDSAIPQLNAELDGLAQMLISRFAAVDGSLQGNEAGLFTASTATTGNLAARLQVNPLVDNAAGGDLSLLLTGLGTGNTLVPGDTSLLMDMMSAFDKRDGQSTPLGQGLSLSDYSASMVSSHQQMRATAENAQVQAEISSATISASRQNLQGVNIDDELQVLMLIEQSYAANSKVLTSLQAMLDDLMNAI